MLDATLASMGWVVSNYLNAGIEPRPLGNDNFTAAPSGTFRTGAGLLNIAANEQRQFESLMDLLGLAELKRDPRFADREARKRHRAELTAAIEPPLALRTAEEWEARLVEAGVPAGRVLTVAEILAHEHTAAGAMVATFADVPGTPREVRVLKPGFRIDGERPAPATRPPSPSEQRDSLLGELGYDAAQRAALLERGAVH